MPSGTCRAASASFANSTAMARPTVAFIQLVPLSDQGSHFLIRESKTHSWASPFLSVASHGDVSLPTCKPFPRIRASLTLSENLSSGFLVYFLFSGNLPFPRPTPSSGSQEVHCLQDGFAACSLLLAPHLHLQTLPRLALSPSCPKQSPFSLSQRPCGP